MVNFKHVIAGWERFLIRLLTVALDKSTTAFNISVTPWVIVPDTSKAFDNVYHASLNVYHASLCLGLNGISGQFLELISAFLSNKWFCVVLHGKTWKECHIHSCCICPQNRKVSQCSLENTCVGVSFLKSCNFIKKGL